MWKKTKVSAVIDEPDGKWPDELGAVMILESQWFEQWIQNFLGSKGDEMIYYSSAMDYIITHPPELENPSPWEVLQTLDSAFNWTEFDKRRNPQKYSLISDFLSSFRVNDYAQMVIFNDKLSPFPSVRSKKAQLNMFRNRLEIYQKDYASMKEDIYTFGDHITEALSPEWYRTTVNAPLLILMVCSLPSSLCIAQKREASANI